MDARFGSLGRFWSERVDRQVLPCHGIESRVYRLPGVDSLFILGSPFVVETTPVAFKDRRLTVGSREKSLTGQPLLDCRISRSAT